jgi:hypothetical protein
MKYTTALHSCRWPFAFLNFGGTGTPCWIKTETVFVQMGLSAVVWDLALHMHASHICNHKPLCGTGVNALCDKGHSTYDSISCHPKFVALLASRTIGRVTLTPGMAMRGDSPTHVLRAVGCVDSQLNVAWRLTHQRAA